MEEIKIGARVRTLIDKTDNDYLIPSGHIGYICDTEHINEGFVEVQFFDEKLIENSSCVFSYSIDEIEVID